jgi:tripartite-type tricarboxylate transporter receptor subunit TctC
MSARKLLAAIGVTCALLGATAAQAQSDFPNKPIRLIVGLAPGGLADQTARLIAPSLSKTLGASVVVENRAGANGALAARQVADAPPDGYTLMVVLDGTLVIGAALGNVNFDPVKDFTPIARIIDTPMTVVANPKVAASNIAELVALSKRPGQKEIFYGSAGTGSSGHLVGEYLKQLTGLKMNHVPYKGAADATSDTVSGQIDLIISSASTTLPFVDAGTLKIVAVTGDKPLPQQPKAPLAKDSGLPELKSFNVKAWAGLVGPPNMPQPLVNKVYDAVKQALNDPELVNKFAVVSAQVASNTPEAFGKQIAREARQWSEVVDKANLKTAK